MWTFFAILSNSVGTYQSIATLAYRSEEEIVDEVLHQVLSAIQNAPSNSKKICTLYIDKLCRDKNISAAARLLRSLRDKNIGLSPDAYNLLLVAAGEENDIDLLSQIFKDLLVSYESIHSASYLSFAKAFAKTSDSGMLLRVVREVSELICQRNAAVVNRIIFAFANCGQVDKALMLFEHLKTLKCEPDLVTYNTVLGILGRASKVDEMLHKFASMKEANIVPDIVSYNTLLNSLRKAGRLDLSLVFFREMGEKGIEPDLRTYTALIECSGRLGQLEESLRLFGEMKLRGIQPSIYVYRSLIHFSKKMGKLELAMNISEEMNACLANLVGPKDFKKKYR
ncbi:hypothetical protein RJ640_008150 [Escallonia rubra]|uniref:Pentatricopeptide repeat-containing protein n=1 Tax=Escallonia rubra TaxID=112253 RepID=A0AA88UI75_9ASTE|nr:hypothetical protein RJ640_008150 [Escallonia rubra]